MKAREGLGRQETSYYVEMSDVTKTWPRERIIVS